MKPPKAIKEKQKRENLGIRDGKPNANANEEGGGGGEELIALVAEVEETNGILVRTTISAIPYDFLHFWCATLEWKRVRGGDGENRMQQQKPKTEPAHSSSSSM